ncbi:nuclear transport factor 2 family protein [Flavobacterium sedimenticola]|uniref:Nuclear transport factor 2 family protein n=1 Tax=Flavobacterium sedimenticola TaxID=3043286 RepID=A0ABT6XQ26_9FLAO|nr:nuclear transport factor 2 family protein [Flavobacterium sedimenticola]MDI9257161.1 nuclear transport factor 2 family protein [Flavobacterium sedimenticola]
MKKLFLLLALSVPFWGQAQKEAVQQTIETFFEGFHAKDTLKIKSTCSEALVLQSISESSKGTRFSTESPKEFYISIATIPENLKFEERILSYTIQIDGTMAHAWTPYEFYINGKLSHKGVNAFTLFLDGTSWKIVHLIDTRRN